MKCSGTFESFAFQDLYIEELEMDINTDISNVTSLPWRGNTASFNPLQELSQATRDRNMNQRQLKIPKNIELLEDYDDENETDYEAMIDDASSNIDKNYSITTAVKEINGGLDLSNQHWENYWSKRIEDMAKLKQETPTTSSVPNDTQAHTDEKQVKNNQNSNTKLSKRKKKMFKNAAIMGLVNTKVLALEEILGSDNESSENADLTHNQHEIISNTQYQQLIPHHEDPEILIHPLHQGIDRKKFKDIDFTVAHVGKHRKVTPREYFLRETTDDFFQFVKKKNDI